MVIPVLALPYRDWAEAVPLMADKRFLSWEAGLDTIAQDVAGLFNRQPAADWEYRHPREWVGPVWIGVYQRLTKNMPLPFGGIRTFEVWFE